MTAREVRDPIDLCAPNEAGCWIWQGTVNQATGYAMYGSAYAHRVMYEGIKGEIPFGLTIDHLCKVTRCVNPDHLEAVTHRENTLRSNNPAALNARKTHCQNGHEFNAENTRPVKRPGGNGRMCITCNRAYQRKLYAAAKAAA